MGFEDLTDVHPRWNAQRVEHDIDRRAVLEERHVFGRVDLGDHALVAVAAGHLVAGLQLALHRDVDLDHLEHARGQLVATLDLLDLVFEPPLDDVDLVVEFLAQVFQHLHRFVVLDRDLAPLTRGELPQHAFVDGRALVDAFRAVLHDLPHEHVFQARVERALDDGAFVVAVLGEGFDFLTLDGQRTLVLVHPAAGEDADVDDGPHGTRGQPQRAIAHVGSFLTEDRAQQFLFRGHRAFALWRDLTDQDIARLHLGTDVDDAGLIEVAQRVFANVWDVAGDFLGAELGVARHDFVFVDVDRGEDVVAHDALVDEDGVLEVVALPRHERDQHVPAERQFAQMGRRAVGDDIALLDPVTDLHQRALDDAGGLVRALELGQAVNLDPGFGVGGEVHFPDHDTAGVDLVDHARALGNHGCAGIASNGRFHAGADERRLGADQRNGLPHHVRAHQGAVRVVVLQERHQRRGDGDQLLGRYVDQVDVGGQGHHEFAVGPRGDEVFGQLALGVDRGVGLSDGEALLLHGREVDNLIGDLTLLNLAVRGFNEAVLVDAGVGGQRVDQADVRAFRGLDRADPAVVGRVHVADFEARTLAGQTARTQRRQAALVGDFGERVGLVHEL